MSGRREAAVDRQTARHAGHAAPYEPVFVGRDAAPASSRSCSRSYPTKQACLLPALWMVQEARGWISRAGDGRGGRRAGAHAGVREGRGHVLHDVPHRIRSGRHFIQVCTTSPCNICGAEDVVQALLEADRLRRARRHAARRPVHGHRSRVPRRLRLPHADPVDDDFIENVTPEKVPGILAEVSRNGLSRIRVHPKETRRSSRSTSATPGRARFDGWVKRGGYEGLREGARHDAARRSSKR